MWIPIANERVVPCWKSHRLRSTGIRPGAPGFKEIIIKPAIVGDQTWVKAHREADSLEPKLHRAVRHILYENFP